MRFKRILAAALAGSMTASAVLCTSAFQAFAEDTTLTFDFRSGDSNTVTVSADDIAASDITIPVNIYIPENPGVNGINLKLQINDGQEDENGILGNYGFKLADAAPADPSCFAKNDQMSELCDYIFNADKMNFFFSNGTKNAVSSAEEGTSAWNSDASWAYSGAFATTNLVIPKGTPNGEYTLDIRRDRFVNSLSSGKAVAYGKSLCTSADEVLTFNSIPLTVKINAENTDEKWEDSYEIAGKGHYIILGNVCGAPGEDVSVPVMIYNDPGTAGFQFFFSYDQRMTLKEYEDPLDNYAYRCDPQVSADAYPASFVFGGANTMKAQNGSILTNLIFTIPEDAAEGTVYDVDFYKGDPDLEQKVVDRYSTYLTPQLIGGSVTVVKDSSVALSRTSLNFSEEGEEANLTIFNATGSVTWKSDDESVAKVDQNGYVTAVGDGNAVITATNNGKDYTCTVKVGGLFGDVDQNGIITSNDAQITLIHYAETLADNDPTLTDAQLAIADVSGDGKVTSKDAQMILTYFLEVVVNEDDEITWYDVTENPNAPGAP